MGAPKANKNAESHGLYSKDQEDENPDSLKAILERLKRRLEKLEHYLEDHWDDLEPADLVRVTGLQAQTVSRIARIERDLQHFDQEQGQEDEFHRAINEALDILSEQWGIQL